MSCLLISREKITVGCVLLDRRRPGEVHRQRRLARTGPAGHHDHLPRVQAVGDLVQLLEAGLHPGPQPAVGRHPVHLVQGALEQILDPDVVLAGPPLGHLVDLGLRPVHHVVDGAGHALATGRAVAHLHDPGAGLDQPPQDRTLGHDLGVVAGVGRGRHPGDQRVQVRVAADPGDGAGPGQLGGHRHRVGRLAPAVQVEDRVVDQLVRRTVEVVAAQHLDHVGDRVLGQQHAAEHGLLGLDVLRRGPIEPRAGLSSPSPPTARRPGPDVTPPPLLSTRVHACRPRPCTRRVLPVASIRPVRSMSAVPDGAERIRTASGSATTLETPARHGKPACAHSCGQGCGQRRCSMFTTWGQRCA